MIFDDGAGVAVHGFARDSRRRGRPAPGMDDIRLALPGAAA
jgi:hypothetical protein